ncbi:nucleoside deaminase [Rhodoplanes serenus]|jgi:tRNA(adenine34) deaminase|uniref:Nucleoside deaminase n=1 Tax=Rhodoplanes serenus TaxID=200615 RepID=A0A9X4XRS7_9BRAD|nr:nucleoside deaminase [Rhodoplanes serenus]MTW17441.1 nucleoside deaminase [Rhodoplanes serenus]
MDAARLHGIDERMMRRAIALGAAAGWRELPFACVIARGDEVVAEATNAVRREQDVTRHAEIVAMATARRALGRRSLAGCTLYTTVEPCAMCAFAIRESRLGRVVYGLRSPMMGGHSRWDILADATLSRSMPEVFGAPPEVRPDVMAGETERGWLAWNPLVWSIIRLRGCFVAHDAQPGDANPSPPRRARRRTLRSLFSGL